MDHREGAYRGRHISGKAHIRECTYKGRHISWMAHIRVGKYQGRKISGKAHIRAHIKAGQINAPLADPPVALGGFPYACKYLQMSAGIYHGKNH